MSKINVFWTVFSNTRFFEVIPYKRSKVVKGLVYKLYHNKKQKVIHNIKMVKVSFRILQANKNYRSMWLFL